MSRSFILALPLAVCAASPLPAQEAEDMPSDEGVEEGLDLLNRGTRLLLEEFMNRMDPALDEFRRELGPALEAFRDRIDDLGAYHPPEILPNGDIILRRKEPLDPPIEPGPVPNADGSVDL